MAKKMKGEVRGINGILIGEKLAKKIASDVGFFLSDSDRNSEGFTVTEIIGDYFGPSDSCSKEQEDQYINEILPALTKKIWNGIEKGIAAELKGLIQF